MKIFICACTIILIAFQTRAFSQNTHLPSDSVTTLLCKKWQIDYVISQDIRIDYPSSNPRVYIEFYKDGTFSLTGGEPSGTEKGIWLYNKSKGTISMSFKGKDPKDIISLTSGQLAFFSDDPASDPNHPERVPLKAKVYFRVKSD